ncbi:MAG: hypothetical protein PHF35_01150 [Candidatus Moranbacteria bacterium]|nr:hypothetical protein [Candidatus Moranbacteria bacterium]
MKLKKFSKYALLATIIFSLGYFSPYLYSKYIEKKTNVETASISNEQSPSGSVLGEEENQNATNSFSSENFRTPHINFGGAAITVPSGQQSLAPEIEDLRSELLMTKTDEEVRFLLSWTTNKPCLSSIEYMREGQTEGKIISEDGYGFVHSAEITKLNYSTSYSYVVNAKDKWGNFAESGKLAFYTGAPNVSIFDLLSDAFGQMFGWAKR